MSDVSSFTINSPVHICSCQWTCSNQCSPAVLDSRQRRQLLAGNGISIKVLLLKENRQSSPLLTPGNVWITAVLSSLTIDKQNWLWKVNILKSLWSIAPRQSTHTQFLKIKPARTLLPCIFRQSTANCSPSTSASPKPHYLVLVHNRRANGLLERQQHRIRVERLSTRFDDQKTAEKSVSVIPYCLAVRTNRLPNELLHGRVVRITTISSSLKINIRVVSLSK